MRRVIFEITERPCSHKMFNDVLVNTNSMTANGYLFAIDDFGAGPYLNVSGGIGRWREGVQRIQFLVFGSTVHLPGNYRLLYSGLVFGGGHVVHKPIIGRKQDALPDMHGGMQQVVVQVVTQLVKRRRLVLVIVLADFLIKAHTVVAEQVDVVLLVLGNQINGLLLGPL